jgi:hypothetical protein
MQPAPARPTARPPARPAARPNAARRLRVLVAVLAAVLAVAAGGRAAAGCPAAGAGCVVLAEPDGAALKAALAAAPAGGTVLLGPGGWGALKLGPGDLPGAAPGRPVTLGSADPARPARFAWMDLRGIAHFRLESLEFRYRHKPGDSFRLRPFAIADAADIAILRSRILGDLATGPGVDARARGFATAYGLSLTRVDGARIEDNEVATWLRGMVVGHSRDLVVRGNRLHAMRSDGMNFVAVDRVTIEANTFRDFAKSDDSGDHPDMIQFWTNGTARPSTGIVIRRNLLHAGTGGWTQSIFMRNEEVDTGRAGREMFYRDVTIEENVIVNAHLHGITLGEAEGVTIRANTLVRQPGAGGGGHNPRLWTPRINLKSASRGVTVEGNVTGGIAGLPDDRGGAAGGREGVPAGWRVAGNLVLDYDDPAARSHVDAVFVAATTGDPADPRSFSYLPGGPAGAGGPGAAALALPALADGPAPLVRVRRSGDGGVLFDAGLSRGPVAGAPGGLPSGTRLAWDFGDGTRAAGPPASHALQDHAYARPGRYRATLTLVLPDGRRAQAEARVAVRGAEVLRFDAATGVLAALAFGEVRPRPEIAARPVSGAGADIGHVLPVGPGDDGTVPALPPGAIAGVFGAEAVEIALRLRARPGSDPRRRAGEVLRIHPALVLVVTPTGGLQLRLATAGAARAVQVTTAPLGVNRGGWHDIVLRHDAAAGQAEIAVDGRVRARGRVAGPMPGAGHHGLAFGNPFGRPSFPGEIAALAVTARRAGSAAAGKGHDGAAE